MRRLVLRNLTAATTAAIIVSVMAGAAPASAGPIAVTQAAVPSAAPAPITSGAKPASVPSGYLLTPNGWFHPDCVHEIRDDQMAVSDPGKGLAIVTLPQDSNLRAAGSVAARNRPTAAEIARSPHLPKCAHSRFDVGGRKIADSSSPESSSSSSSPSSSASASSGGASSGGSADAAPPAVPGFTGWIEKASTTSLGALSYLYAEFNVPPAPAVGGATVYFFPAMQNVTILQPVLAWNQGGSGIPGWSIASWNCCGEGQVVHSSYRAVNAGTKLAGTIAGTGCSTGSGVCQVWTVVTTDLSNNGTVSLATSPSYPQSQSFLIGAALEVWYLDACNQLPNGASVLFRNYVVKDIFGTRRTPNWTADQPGSDVTPSNCGYGTTVNADKSVTLDYSTLNRRAPAACPSYTYNSGQSFVDSHGVTRVGRAYAGFSSEMTAVPSSSAVTAAGREAQCLLARFYRWNPGSIDGQFGPNSRAAALAFQKDTNLRYGAGTLSEDGLVGPNTWKWLRFRAAFVDR